MFATSVRQALSSGNDGQVDDELAFVHSWGFDVGTIDVPVTIWHGQQDRMVPARHAARLKELIDQAAVHVIPDDGHLSIFLGNTREVAASVMS